MKTRILIYGKIVLSILLLSYISLVKAQKGSGYDYAGRVMYRIPDSLTKTTDGIAGYVNSNFSNDKEKSRAIFIWISRNINYIFDSIITNSIYETPSEVSERILRTRTGVCLNFAHLFNELSNKAGIKTYIIQGYTKQSGRVDYLPHIWCASFIDTAWYLFDPTWGSGYVSRGQYIKQVNGYYFMAKPEKLIRSHMPFDPMWQFLNYPITHQEFKNGRIKAYAAKPWFNYKDSLITWENSTDLERAVAAARRIENCGVTNNFIAAKLRVVKGDAEFLKNQGAARLYDTAVIRYNQGIQSLNRFIGYRNDQVNDSVMLISILDSSETSFNSALLRLDHAKPVDTNIIASIQALKNAIQDTQRMLNLQRAAFISQLKTKHPNKQEL